MTVTFDLTSTTTDVLSGMDLTGRTVVVTGASSGLGAETARGLASVGTHVVMAVRDHDKGLAVADRIRASDPQASLELTTVDLASLASIRAFADRLMARHGRIDRLINNAGVMAPPLSRPADALELQFG